MRCKDMNNLVFSKNDAAILFFLLQVWTQTQTTLLTVFGKKYFLREWLLHFNDSQTWSGST